MGDLKAALKPVQLSATVKPQQFSATLTPGGLGGSGQPQTPWAQNIDGGGFALANAVSVTSPQLLAGVSIDESEGPFQLLDGTDFVYFQPNWMPRWNLSVTGAESGGNSGSDFQIYAFDDDGNGLGPVLQLTRATGVMDFAYPPTVMGQPIGGGSQTPWTSDIDAAQFSLTNTQYVFAGTVLVAGANDADSVGLNSPYMVIDGTEIFWFAQGQNLLRWQLVTESPESGGNSGSNLDLNRYDDTGLLISQVVSFNRATGVVDFVNQPTVNGVKLPGNKFHTSHTFALVGDVTAITTLPSMFVSLTGTQAITLFGLRASIASGTSVGVQVQRNGVNVGSAITVTTTVALASLGSVPLAEGDALTLVLSAPVGTPSNFGASLILEHTL